MPTKDFSSYSFKKAYEESNLTEEERIMMETRRNQSYFSAGLNQTSDQMHVSYQ